MTPSTTVDAEKYNAVRAAIIKANPEIMDLKFGCLIRTRLWGEGVITAPVAKESYLVNFPEKGDLVRKEMWCSTWLGDEIIGRPIHLADVLIAIKERCQFQSNFEIEKDIILRLVMAKYQEGYFVEEQLWRTHIDDLSLQSSEVIDFLHKILCK